jgi:nicotinamide mononucleotide (NMN) deamidase PncC
MQDTAARDNSEMIQAPMDLDLIAAETTALLHRVSVQLALAEAGMDGEIANLLTATGFGGAVLTHSRIYGPAEELAAGLRVSPAKVDAFGAISAMVAAEAAAELIDTYEGGWGLVVMAPVGNRPAEPSVPSGGGHKPHGFIALGTPSTTVIQQCSPDQIVRATFELLREQGLRRLART